MSKYSLHTAHSLVLLLSNLSYMYVWDMWNIKQRRFLKGPSRLTKLALAAGTLNESMVVTSTQLVPVPIKPFLAIICLSWQLTSIDNPVHHNGLSVAYNVWIFVLANSTQLQFQATKIFEGVHPNQHTLVRHFQ